ncbi:hypothetical protein, conserved [Babesia ovata]|uniref:Extracellular matrix-binding ebh n=1 Tax=Babesia ovata TaxID=189622 RepID=A0A2H6KJG7_9APIC|nr:uncharacterized protein BOVATA_046130 [Babesia ovata]GBE63120.1 hypothetical protein, conserved [Babesia ovata]
MSFLHGVLDTLKNDESVTTYDNNPLNDINNVLRDLHDNVGKGRQAFPEAVSKVSEWLNRHGEQVEERTRGVKDKLGELIGKLSSDAGEYYEEVKGQEGKPLVQQLEAWMKTLKGIDIDLKNSETKHIELLDSSLKNNVMHNIASIRSALDVLKSLAHDKKFIVQVGEVDNALMKQSIMMLQRINAETEGAHAALEEKRKSAIADINRDFPELQKTVDDDFGRIIDHIGSLREAKNKCFEKINDALQKAKTTIEFHIAHVDKRYKIPIPAMIEDIKKALRCFDKSDVMAGGNTKNCRLHNDVEGIKCKVKEIEDTYKGKLISVKAKVDKAVDEAVKHLTEVDDAVRKGLLKAREDIQNGLDGYVGKLKSALEAGMSVATGKLSDMKGLNAFESALIGDLSTLQGLAKSMHKDAKDNLAFSLEVLFFYLQRSKQSALPSIDILKSVESVLKSAISGKIEAVIPDGSRDLKQIKFSDNALMKEYFNETKTAADGGVGDGILTGHIKGIKNQFGDVITKDTSGNYKVDANKIMGYDDKEGGGVRPSFDIAIKAILQKIETLEKLPGEVGQMKTEIESAMIRLSKEFTNLDAEIGAIERNFNEADQRLHEAISAVHDSVYTAHSIAAQAVEAVQMAVIDAVQRGFNGAQSAVHELTQNVTQEAKRAFQFVTKQVQELFAEARKADLEALKTLITKQSYEVRTKINDNKSSGLKGFLTKFKERFVTPIGEFDVSLTPPPKASGVMLASPKTFNEWASKLYYTFNQLIEELKTQDDYKHVHSNVEPSRQSLQTLLQGLHASGHFNHTFNTNLDNLNNALHNFEPKRFSAPCSIVLDALKDGLNALATQLGFAYVNSYSGQPWEPGYEENHAKIFFTLISPVFHKLHRLFYKCTKDWIEVTINGNSTSEKHKDALKTFLQDQGYDIQNLINKQHTGWDVAGKLDIGFHTYGEFTNFNIREKRFDLYLESHKKSKNSAAVLQKLFTHTNQYIRVGHLVHSPSTRYPCSVYEQLCWLNGLPHNFVFEPLCKYFMQLFEKPQDMRHKEYHEIDPHLLKQEAYPYVITYEALKPALHEVCSKSYPVLIGILGHGHAQGTYASDFSNNALNLYYPSSMTTLVCTIREIVRQLYQQLYFLYNQCRYETELSGWRDCSYGRGVGGSAWKCNTKQCADQNCPQTCDQKHNQTCKQHPNCGLKSPLQSFLEDGLVGFLPHNLSTKGTSFSCSSCPKTSPKTPCKIPMGFSEISVTASHTKLGEDILEVLDTFCGNRHSPLTRICTVFNSLLPSAPQTLGDLFGFYFNLLDGWNTKEDGIQKHREIAFCEAVNDANFGRRYTLDVNPRLSSVIHSSNQTNHRSGDMFSLVKCVSNSKSLHPCGTYLQSMSRDVYSIFSASNKKLYLSWLIYITERLYDLLRELFDECNRNCGSKGSKCKMSMCYDICNSKKPQSSSKSKHDESCHSIVECRFTLPTFSKYGFYFADASDLAGDIHARRISLGQLAGQLSGFIGGGEEVKDAILNGLHSNVNQLEKLLKTSCGGEGCCEYNDVKNNLNNINEIFKNHLKEEQKASKNLTDILNQCKLNDLNGPLKQLNDAITQKIEKLNEQIKQLELQQSGNNKSKNASEIGKFNKDLQSHNASKRSLETLKELCEIANKVNSSPSGECKNLLPNLTEGLEKFLGFNQTSKGYDGTGIVYSDLDRLCDGVMSFLHGVLQTVKDDESVTTYDNNPLNDINNVLRDLHDNVGKGRQAFPEAVSKVSEWLNRHGEQVEERTRGVKDKLGELIGKLSSDAGEYYTQVTSQERSSLETQLGAWNATVQAIHWDLDIIENQKVNDLDSSLISQITQKLEPVTTVIKHLKSVADDQEFGLAVGKVDSDIAAKKKHVREQIVEKSSQLRQKVNTKFDEIEQNIATVEGKREEDLASLMELVANLQIDVTDADRRAQVLAQHYDNKIVKKLNSMNDDVKGLNTVPISDGLQQVFDQVSGQLEPLKSQLDALAKAGKQIQQMVLKDLEYFKKDGDFGLNVSRQITQLRKELNDKLREYVTRYVKKVQWEVSKIRQSMDAVKPTSVGLHDSEFYKEANKVKDNISVLNGGLEKGAGLIGEAIHTAVTGVESALQQLDTKVQEDLGKLRTGIESELKIQMQRVVTAIQTKVNEIISGKRQNGEGLQAIKTKVWTDYASNFTKETFENTTLLGWIQKILDENEAVKDKLKLYVEGNTAGGKSYFNGSREIKNAQALHESIKTEIKKKLQAEVYTREQVTFVKQTTGKVLTDLNAVKGVCNDLSRELNKKLDAKNFAKQNTTLASDIATKIEEQLVQHDKRGTYSHNLVIAVSYILSSLSTATRHIASELTAFVQSCRFGNVDGALTTASSLITKLTPASDGAGNPSTNFADEINKDIIDTLTQKIGKAHTEISLQEKMDAYYKWVKGTQPLDSTSLKYMIDNIKRDVQKFFQSGTVDGTSSFNLADNGSFGDYLTQRSEAEKAIRNMLTKMETLEGAYEKIDMLDTALTTSITFSTPISTPDTGVALTDSIEKRVEANVESNEVNKQLGTLLNETAGKAIDKVDAKVNSIISSGLSDVGPNIKTQIEMLVQGSQQNNIRKLVDDLQRQINEAQSLVDTTKENAEGDIKRQVEELKNQVGTILEGIRKISAQITEFNSSLREAIDGARDAINSARQELQAKIIKDKDELTRTTEQAFDAVHTAAKQMFCKGHQEDLTKLHDLVEKQKSQIQTIIDEDKVKGVKGLLGKMKSDLMPPLNAYVTPASQKVPGNLKEESDKKKLRGLCATVNAGVSRLCLKLEKQTDFVTDYSKIKSSIKALTTLLTDLSYSNHFDHTFTKNLSEFNAKLEKCVPKQFGDAETPLLLNSIRSGLDALAKELQKHYVNKYEGCQPIKQWVSQSASQNDGQSAGQNTKLTPEGRKGAQVCLTIIHNLMWSTHHLFYNCLRNYRDIKMDGSTAGENKHELSKHLQRHGFDIDNLKTDKTGREVAVKLGNGFHTYSEFHKDPQQKIDFNAYLTLAKNATNGAAVLLKLFNYLETYNQVCHLELPKYKRYPCSVRDMLGWMCGLPYTAVYKTIEGHCKKLLNEENKATGKMPNREDPVICEILQRELCDNLSLTCQNSYHVLVTICGNGHGAPNSDYPYACEYSNNSRSFHYPTTVSALFDMLSDICRRLLCALYLLRIRCRYAASHGNGWRDCAYGQNIGGSSWSCNTKQCANQKCPQKVNQNTKQRCDQHPKCGVKSPLQAHLTDSLPGCLPHKLTSVGCSSKCLTCPKNSPGQQCIPPMGFWDLSTAASKQGVGNDIHDVLKRLCKDAYSPLPKLLHCLWTLHPSPPRSLGDMFAFYYNMFMAWTSTRFSDYAVFRSHLVDKTIPKCLPLGASVHNSHQASELTDALANLQYTSDDHKQAPQKDDPTKTHCDLCSITTKSTSCTNGLTCAPYIQSLSGTIYHTYANKNANLCLSWFVHLAWRLWEQLNELYEAFQGIDCKSSGCSKCNCSSGKHGDEERPCSCASIVECGGVLSTMYRFGCTFGSVKILNEKKVKCSNFTAQLYNVLHSPYFEKLFNVIDNFIYCIRLPFMTLLLALWSLSLLYLLHIAVVRLDVLRIRSHLRSPSSHRIAAQSLLAAARVRALANVKYFSP